MPNLKVFISSTCYDLNVVRSQVRTFVKSLGHDPIMSDFMEVLYDPREHTHESCLKEVTNCDIVILIIGSRYGGKGIPKAISAVDIDKLKEKSYSPVALDGKDNLSVTQLEVCKAIENSIPVFAFVSELVWHDHLVYETNKGSETIDNIKFPSIEKPETAKYIFEFINFLRHRSVNNSIVSFSRVEDIENFLKKQWSSLFQKLLEEQRNKESERRRMDLISTELADLKAAIMSSISAPDLRETARGAVRFRRLIEFLSSLQFPNQIESITTNCSWDELLIKADIVDIKIVSDPRREGYMSRDEVTLIKSDGTFYKSRLPSRILQDFAADWEAWRQTNDESKKAIFDAVIESSRRGLLHVRYYAEQFSDVYPEEQIKERIKERTIFDNIVDQDRDDD